MLTDYRKRFVALNMLLSSPVLLVAFVILGTVMCRSEYSDLENTMSVMIKPWNIVSERYETKDEPKAESKNEPRPEPKNEPDQNSKPEPKNEPKDEPPPERRRDDPHEKPPGDERRTIERSTYEQFTTVMYNEKEKSMSVISEGTNYDEERIFDAVKAVVKEKGSFGRTGGYYYYCEKTQSDVKLAFVDSSYLTVRLVKSVALLLLLYLALIAVIYFISLRLSRLATEPLERAIEMERNFVADISHDLKTPITVVLTNNSILRSNPEMSASERRQWTESTDAAAKNMMKLVNEMLTLSQLESIDRSVKREKVLLSSIAEKCALQLESVAYEQEVTVDTDIEDGVFIMAAPEYAERICTGLIDNALKYEPRGGSVAVTVRRAKKSAVLIVKNAGSVISEDDLPHIFERFYRGDKTRGVSRGHGLGLPIIRQTAELVGAQVTAESSQRSGTVFTVTFEAAE